MTSGTRAIISCRCASVNQESFSFESTAARLPAGNHSKRLSQACQALALQTTVTSRQASSMYCRLHRLSTWHGVDKRTKMVEKVASFVHV